VESKAESKSNPLDATCTMNSALFHAARPGDIRSGGERAGGLGGGGQARAGMREAAAVAKEMGFGQDFGPQAANMWKMLDDLAVTDSAAYAEMAKAGAEALRKPKGKFFTPNAGFVVKASLQRPWAPPPNATDIDAGSESKCTRKVVENAAAGTKVFVNMCSHDGVSPPIDQADREVDIKTEGRNASGLRIPMFVSPVRETTDHSDDRALAVDVVFHPWVLRCSKGEPFFRDQVVALATGWITQEHPGLVLSRRRKLLKLCTYKGGNGRKGGNPVPFPADDACVQAQSLDERKSEGGSNEARGRSGSGGGSGVGGLLDDPNNKSDSASSTSTRESLRREDHEGRTTAKLRLDPSGVNRESNILLPEALAGLKSDGRKRAGKVSGEVRRGPLISEITPATATLPPDGRGEDRLETTEESVGIKEVRGGGDAGQQVRPAEHGQGARRGDEKESPAVRKGFLCSSKGGCGKDGRQRAPLYPPSGSENGAAPSAYVKLMSRCKVVDTRDHTKEEMDAAMKAHAGGSAASRQPRTTPPTPSSEAKSLPSSAGERISGKQPTAAAVKRGFLRSGAGGGRLYGEEGSREGGGGSGGGGGSSRADRKFEQLVALADPDMGDSADSARKVKSPASLLLWRSSSPCPWAPFAATAVGTTKKTSSPVGGISSAAKKLEGLQGCSSSKGRAGGADGTGASASESDPQRSERPAEVPRATKAGKQSTSSTSLTHETLPQAVPAPTSTITQRKDAHDTQKSCSKTPPPKRIPYFTSSGVANAEQKEREPLHRIEQLQPSAGAVGIATKQKRTFAVIINLPEVIEGPPESEDQEAARHQQGGSRDGENAKTVSMGSSGRRGTTGLSLSDIELDVSPAVLQLKVPGQYHLRLKMPCIVDEDAVSAKFNKSRAVLRVFVQER
ncbi:unnamed protein product, partial [Scytosiphon promiscuus]